MNATLVKLSSELSSTSFPADRLPPPFLIENFSIFLFESQIKFICFWAEQIERPGATGSRAIWLEIPASIWMVLETLTWIGLGPRLLAYNVVKGALPTERSWRVLFRAWKLPWWFSSSFSKTKIYQVPCKVSGTKNFFKLKPNFNNSVRSRSALQRSWTQTFESKSFSLHTFSTC